MTGRRFGSFLALAALFLAMPAHAVEVSLEGDLVQGGLVIGHTEPGAEAELNGRNLRVSGEGLFVLGLGREAPETVTLRVTGTDGAVWSRRLRVARGDFAVERIDGLPQRQVSPDPETVARIHAENALIAEARKRDTARTAFARKFIWPVRGRISGAFGSQRILNGEPRAPHSGVDIAVPRGTPVRAAADGVVSLVHADMFLTGKTVMIDHGHGVATIYIHMDAIEVAEGEAVRQGAVIGTVGASGRATGAHLHWGLSWFETKLDPARVAGPMSASN